jgi:hypothetical protein
MQKMNAYVECMLGLQREEIGDVLSATLISKVMNLLSDLDVCFRLFMINCSVTFYEDRLHDVKLHL